MPDKNTVKKLIEAELKANRSAPGWKGSGVFISRTQFSLTTGLREQVQAIGDLYGCHTCETRLEIDRDQPWVGDHVPPTELPWSTQMSVMAKNWDGTVYLFPQCHECSHQQSSLVRELKSKRKAYKDLTPTQKRLIGQGAVRSKKNYIESSGPKVTGPEGQQIQELGKKYGCHSCGDKVPTVTYHADHSFPQEFCTSYMEQVFDDLGLTYPNTFELRPQCPRCSGNQGGKIKQIMEVATAYARENLGIVVYKF